MKKDTSIIIIVILTLILSVLVFFTVKQINDNNRLQPMAMQMPNENKNITYTSAYEINKSEEISDKTFSSNTSDENAILVSGDIDVTLSNITVDKTGSSNGGDDTSFYGINSAIVAKDSANLVLKDITVNTDAIGANGIFSYGGSATTNNSSSDGTTITVSNSTITTKKDNSGGIMTTGGAKMIANNLNIQTSGISSAAIRTDRGGGEVIVDQGTYTTNGQGSPSIYSTAIVTVSNANLISNVSEGIIIEGKNRVTINNCNLEDNNTKLNGQSTTYKNIFLYQSMSGDAQDGTSQFNANDSKIITNNGDTFYITNTSAVINLNNNDIINNDKTGNFLRVQKDSWGNEGKNGGSVILNMINQKAQGDIVIDSISTLDMTLKDNSYYEGKINEKNTAKNISIKLDKTSKIKLTGNSYISDFENELEDNSNIDFNGYTLYVNGNPIN